MDTKRKLTQPAQRKIVVARDLAETYNRFKAFEGRQYTGVKIGRGHKWYYDKGEWKERKVSPDRWEFTYGVVKRRAGHAPEGSGVPVGTEYHWYILAHQTVRKLDANNYTTSMTGLKYKLAHKRADRGAWNATDPAQRKRLIAILEETIAQLKAGPLAAASTGNADGHASPESLARNGHPKARARGVRRKRTTVHNSSASDARGDT